MAPLTEYSLQRAVEMGGSSVEKGLAVRLLGQKKAGPGEMAEVQEAIVKKEYTKAANLLNQRGVAAEDVWRTVREAAAKAKQEGGGGELPAMVVPDKSLTWDDLIISEDVKGELQHELAFAVDEALSEGLERLRAKTRRQYRKGARPCRAFLLEGPPGGGKTLTAEILAATSGRPMFRLSPDQFRSELYSVSTTRLKRLLAGVGSQRCLLFLDEVDSWAAPTRDGKTHEETTSQLSVLLEFMDGIDRGASSKCVIIAATNRLDRVDSALRSRMRILHYPAPTAVTAREWWGRNSMHLAHKDLEVLTKASVAGEGEVSFRVMERAARRAEEVAILRSRSPGYDGVGLPTVDDYLKGLTTARRQLQPKKDEAKL